MVEFSKTPIDKSELLLCVINHDVVWLHISVSDTLGVAEIESLKDLVHVVADIKISEALVQSSEVNVSCVDILHDKSGGFSHRVANHINQVDDIDAILQCLQDLDFSSDLSLLH